MAAELLACMDDVTMSAYVSDLVTKEYERRVPTAGGSPDVRSV